MRADAMKTGAASTPDNMLRREILTVFLPGFTSRFPRRSTTNAFRLESQSSRTIDIARGLRHSNRGDHSPQHPYFD
jgi:hypothetical protein